MKQGAEILNILVTGGAGFIGSNLVDLLLENGHSVRVLDDLSMGKLSNLPLDNPSLEFNEGSITNASLVDRCVAGVDAIVHLAAIASVQASVDEPVHTHQTNFDGTLNILEAARKHGVNRVLYASSAAIYGNTEVLPVTEDLPKQPLTPYAADKLAGEFYLDFYYREFGIKSIAFRFFNIYGPRQDPSSPYSGVISIFADRILSKQPLTIFGDGRQTRDFVYVGDLVKILYQGLCAQDIGCHVANVGTGKSSSLLDLITSLEAAVGYQSDKSYAESRPGEIRDSLASNERLNTLLNIIPNTDLSVGISHLIDSINKK